MRNIIYYVAASLDGFISGPNEDVSGFIYTGTGVDQYRSDLLGFDTVLMGRKTYEFGYKFGAVPGEPSPAYPHMQHYIFSDHLHFENEHPQVQVKPLDIREIDQIKQANGGPIYLCGGGKLAGWLLENQKIDELKIKVNPLILGEGIPLFGEAKTPFKLQLVDATTYEHGLQLLHYKVLY